MFPWRSTGISEFYPPSRLTEPRRGKSLKAVLTASQQSRKARTTYDNILRLVDDPDVIAPIRFLREREIVHFQRFGEALETVKDTLDSRNFYAVNPSFDR